MLQDQSRNRTPMPGAQARGAAPPDTGPARAEAGIAAMLTGGAPSAPPAAVSPALAAMVEEWCRLVDEINEPGHTDEEAEPLVKRQDALQMAIYRFPAVSAADLQAKVPVFRDEMQAAVGSLKPDLDPGETLPGAAWLGLMRDFERLAGRPHAEESPAVAGQEHPAPTSETDPVHALIAEHRAAYAEWDRLSKVWNEMVPDTSGYADAVAASDGPAQREVDALDALVTARPTTLAGLLALTEYLPGALRQVDPDAQEPNSEIALRNVAVTLRALGRAGLPDAGLAAALQERRAKADEFLRLMRVDGFVPFPADKPTGLMNIGLAIPAEAERLLGIAQAEFDRRADAYANFPPAEREANLMRMRAAYRIEELAAAVRGRSAAPVPEPSLADQIVASWREFARHMIGRTEDSPEVEEECERLGDRQHEICTMADNLPATAENLLPKALALAAIETTKMVRAGLPRSSYTLDGRLAFDLHAAVTGRAPSEA